MRKLAVAAVSVGLVVAGCTSTQVPTTVTPAPTTAAPAPTWTPEPTPTKESTMLRAAVKLCRALDTEGMKYLRLADDDTTLLIDTRSEYGSVDGAGCVMGVIDTPQRIMSMMNQTTALQGVQEATDGTYDYRWTYHPDNGFEAIISE